MTEFSLRSIGGSLQLMGVILIVVGVYRTRSQLPGFVRVRVRLRRFWRWVTNKGPVVREASGGIHVTVGVTGTAEVRTGWDSLDNSERIEQLREDIKRLENRAAERERKNSERFRSIEDRIKETHQAASERVTTLEQKVHAFVGGNLHLEAIGAAYFFVGIFLVTWAPELAT